MSRLNIELFKKVRDRIAAIPESYDQSAYYTPDQRAPCGTAACIAGETIICAAPTVKQGIRNLKLNDTRNNVSQRAARLLGLPLPNWGQKNEEDYNASAKLFYSSAYYEVFWPEPYGSDFNNAISAEERAKIAVAYLDHIIETGKVLE